MDYKKGECGDQIEKDGSPEEIRTPVVGSKAWGRKVEDVDEVILKFVEFCRVDERLQESVIYGYKYIVKRFLNSSQGKLTRETVRSYLSLYLEKSPKTYNNQLDGLRAFIGRFLKCLHLITGFKKAHVYNNYEFKLPSKEQIKTGFFKLVRDRDRAIYLLFATTGLRKSELLQLKKTDVDFDLRTIKSKHDTRTKKAGVTFYNHEAELYLNQYLATRRNSSNQLFTIGIRQFMQIWDQVSGATGFRITPQVLRRWHSTILGELGVPDRYIDVFQGRSPRNVLAKFYTGTELGRLKRIYDKAGLKVLN